MRKLLGIWCFCSCLGLSAQGFQNNGNVQLHENAAIGFHASVENNGAFFGNSGSLTGFYGNTPILVSGSVPLNAFDLEVFHQNGINVESTMNIANNLNFINGTINTPKTNPDILINFGSTGFFLGENNDNKINGYASMSGQEDFTFPVGDAFFLRSLVLNSDGANSFSQCTYFFEDPANAFSIGQSFDPEAKSNTIGEISAQEFWILTGDATSSVTLSWNTRSNLASIALELEDIIVVGWSKAASQWVNLGNVVSGGDVNEGFVSSNDFVPNDFEVLTLAATPLPLDNFALSNPTLGNYFVSPNGDGINDVLVIDNLDASPNNVVRIFNRLGQKVFEQNNYVNEFGGVANTGGFIPNKEIGLPEGVYYYTASLFDLELEYTGFLFLDR